MSAENAHPTERIAAHFLPDPPKVLGVAVSGGSDSLALLMLLHDWSRAGGPELHAVTVDHGLRPEAAAEARRVADFCAGLGIGHDTLHWQGWDGHGNLPDRARRARYELMADWATEKGIFRVALGHTADDQAETFLMRLAREAGVDGLAAMMPERREGSVVFDRPALGITREALRDVLRDRGVDWIDDPTNDDPHYERARARRALAALAPLGITAPGLATVARHLADVRETLYWHVWLAARDIVAVDRGDLLIARDGFLDLNEEIARRLLQEALKWVSGADYPPRGRAVTRLMEVVRQGVGMTLHGCLVAVEHEQIRVSREYKAVAALHGAPGALWDGRWVVTGPAQPGDVVAALGPEGLARCSVAEPGLPSASLMAGPAVWRGGELLAAPLTGGDHEWKARLVRDREAFYTALLSH